MSHKVSACEVVIAGGGVIGAACARAIAARAGNLQVILCEPGPDPSAASPASAGMLAAQIEPIDDALRGLSLRARDFYDTLAPRLFDATGIDVGLRRDGIASLALDQDSAEQLQEAVAAQRQAGLRCDWLDADEVAERFPVAANCQGALFAPEDGAVNAPELRRALLADAVRLGVRVDSARVERIVTILGKVTAVETSAGKIRTGNVIIAAGSWSPQIAGLPRPLAVEPVRGQMAAVPWPHDTPPAILYCDHHYVLTRGGEALVGSTMEHAGFDARVTAEGIAQIMAAGGRMVPALRDATPTRTWAGLRPVTPDGSPLLGPDPDVRGLWYATGHGRNGVLLAGLSGEIIGSLVTSGATDVDIASLTPERFTS
jgi:glycine oxidase